MASGKAPRIRRQRRTASVAAIVSFLAIAGVCTAGSTQAGPTLDKTRRADALSCGVTTGVAGFSVPDSRGQWTGIDVDVCRGIAAAVLGDATKVKFVPLTTQQRFTALQSGEVDILARVTTWNLSRDTQLALAFGPITVYDGQGFLVPKSLGVKSAKELNGATVCVQPGTTTEVNLAAGSARTGCSSSRWSSRSSTRSKPRSSPAAATCTRATAPDWPRSGRPGPGTRTTT